MFTGPEDTWQEATLKFLPPKRQREAAWRYLHPDLVWRILLVLTAVNKTGRVLERVNN